MRECPPRPLCCPVLKIPRYVLDCAPRGHRRAFSAKIFDRRGGRFFVFSRRQDAEILEYFKDDNAVKRKISPSAAHCALIVLSMLSFCIVGVNVLSASKEHGAAFHEIIMISIAAYTFSKITIAIIGMVKAKRSVSPALKTLRNISLADACVSVYTMQRSMLASFPGMQAAEILLFNVLTGTAVWIIVLFLGINLIGGKRIAMAKSKIVETADKIAGAVTGGYKKIEKGVTEGYKKIERGVVSGYTKIEDKFVDAYLTKDGETVEQAKERLKKQKK